MPTYLWTGKNTRGQEQTERIIANTAEEAKGVLVGRGWTDLQLHTTDIHDFVRQGIDAVSDPEYRPDLTPEQEAAYVKGTAPGFWANWWKSLRESSATLLIVGLWFTWSVWRHKLWSLIISGGVLVAMAFLFPAL